MDDSKTQEAKLRWSRAHAGELPAVEAILRSAFAPYARDMGYTLDADAYDWLAQSVANGTVWIASRETAIVGVVTVSVEAHAWSLDFIAVAPPHQGRGLGTWMLHRLEETAGACGLRRITLHTAKAMTGLQRLYARHGYRVVREGPPPHGRDANPRVYLEKLLG